MPMIININLLLEACEYIAIPLSERLIQQTIETEFIKERCQC